MRTPEWCQLIEESGDDTLLFYFDPPPAPKHMLIQTSPSTADLYYFGVPKTPRENKNEIAKQAGGEWFQHEWIKIHSLVRE